MHATRCHSHALLPTRSAPPPGHGPCRCPQNNKRWGKFFKQIDWTVGENNVYRKWPAEFDYSLEAPKGHLPLTNALRGTQLFQAILEHPAFEKKVARGIDERSKDLAAKPLF